jgi:hypothetical protein
MEDALRARQWVQSLSFIHHSSFIIQNSKFKIQNRLAYEPDTFPELMGFLRD